MTKSPSDVKILATGLTVTSEVDPYFRKLYGTPDQIKAKIDADIENIRAAGFHVELKYVSDASPQAMTESVEWLRNRLRTEKFDGVMIGTGLRLVPEQTALWEEVVNVFIQESPKSVFMFNDGPGRNYWALQRNKERLGITTEY
ncbi:unnamed protein product [Periconia digitata]|uniref:Uncharacterized protein n=1 Tax=Periconia digitata TaxID=1303443 RepID=A0A9W4XM53_9PLEO|nr:unnamed protein product [Periconia digitata]